MSTLPQRFSMMHLTTDCVLGIISMLQLLARSIIWVGGFLSRNMLQGTPPVLVGMWQGMFPVGLMRSHWFWMSCMFVMLMKLLLPELSKEKECPLQQFQRA